MTASLTPSEDRAVAAIREKDRALRRFLAEQSVAADVAPAQWLSYLTGIKAVLGNLSNDLGFVETLLVKHYLERRFAITDFDAAGKAQGATGVDIEAATADGRTIVGELKTTTPRSGFGTVRVWWNW
jgi:hypothetical protein